jgi:hypothetical protein
MVAELAQYNYSTGALLGGKLAEVQAILSPAHFDTATRAEATLISEFYRELSQPITEENKQDCYNWVHAILDA